MPSTPLFAFPYPPLTNAPNVPSDMQSLALSAENVLNASSTTLVFGTGGNVDISTSVGTQQTWVTMSAGVIVPSWATRCLFSFAINGFYAPSGSDNATVALQIGSQVATFSRLCDPGGGARGTFAIQDTITGLTAGSKPVTVVTVYTAGTAVRADTLTRFSAKLNWAP